MSDLQAIADEAVKGYRAMQKPRELEALLRILALLRLNNVLEVGGMYGGTLWAWSHVCAGPYTCIDLQVLEGRMEALHDIKFNLVIGDSTRTETAARLGDQRFDFIFIDGDHRYESVKRDFENYYPLLSANGVIAFHDICHRRMRGHDMWRFWHEVIDGRFGYEIYDPSFDWGGIGVLTTWVVDKLPDYCYPAGTLEKPAQCEEQRCGYCEKVLDVDVGEEHYCPVCAMQLSCP